MAWAIAAGGSVTEHRPTDRAIQTILTYIILIFVAWIVALVLLGVGVLATRAFLDVLR